MSLFQLWHEWCVIAPEIGYTELGPNGIGCPMELVPNGIGAQWNWCPMELVPNGIGAQWNLFNLTLIIEEGTCLFQFYSISISISINHHPPLYSTALINSLLLSVYLFTFLFL